MMDVAKKGTARGNVETAMKIEARALNIVCHVHVMVQRKILRHVTSRKSKRHVT